MNDLTEQERDAAVIAAMRDLLTAVTPGNWKFDTFSTAMDGDEEIGELVTDDSDIGDVMWATGDWKGKSQWIEFRLEADKLLIERAKEHGETALRELDRLQADNARLRAACEGVPEMLTSYSAELSAEPNASMFRTVVEQLIVKAAAIRAALGIESEATE